MCTLQGKNTTFWQTGSPYCLACKSSQQSVLPLIPLVDFLSTEVWSPPVVDAEYRKRYNGPSFIKYCPVPVRHGCVLVALARPVFYSRVYDDIHACFTHGFVSQLPDLAQMRLNPNPHTVPCVPNRYGKRGACAELSYSLTPSTSRSISHWWAR